MGNTWNTADDLMVALLRHSSCDAVGRLNSSPKQYNPPSRSRNNPRSRRSLFCPRAQNPKDDETPFQTLRILQSFLWTECRIFLQKTVPPPSHPFHLYWFSPPSSTPVDILSFMRVGMHLRGYYVHLMRHLT